MNSDFQLAAPEQQAAKEQQANKDVGYCSCPWCHRDIAVELPLPEHSLERLGIFPLKAEKLGIADDVQPVSGGRKANGGKDGGR